MTIVGVPARSNDSASSRIGTASPSKGVIHGEISQSVMHFCLESRKRVRNSSMTLAVTTSTTSSSLSQGFKMNGHLLVDPFQGFDDTRVCSQTPEDRKSEVRLNITDFALREKGLSLLHNRPEALHDGSRLEVPILVDHECDYGMNALVL